MSKLSKQFIIILLLLSMILVGCEGDQDLPSNHGNDIPPELYESQGKPIYGPVEIPYIIENPIEIIDIRVSDDTNQQQSYFQIRGLVDEAVEEKINGAIKTLFEELVPFVTGEKLPPYRGMKAAIREDADIRNGMLSVFPQYNYNNVLSVGAFVSGTYPDGNNWYIHFNTADSLNFDLTTGNTFLIEDIFTNDVDGLELVNEVILNDLTRRRLNSGTYYDEYANYNLVAPFRGIKRDQKFYLNEEGLNVIIDHQNPEFNVGYNSETVMIPFSGNINIAITERFHNVSPSIYTSEPYAKRFLRDHFVTRHSESEEFEKDNAHWSISISYPNDLTNKIQDVINEIKEIRYEEVLEMSKESPISFVVQNIYANRMGKYISVGNNLYIARMNEGIWKERTFVYTENLKILELDDLFVEGFDYTALIKKAFYEAFKQYSLTPKPEQEELLNTLMFKINETAISFTTEYYEWQSNNSHSLYFTIDYEEFGYDNLKIFD